MQISISAMAHISCAIDTRDGFDDLEQALIKAPKPSPELTGLPKGHPFFGLKVGHTLMIRICNFHVLSHLLLIYICKLHWNLNTMFVCQVNYF